MVKKKLGEGTGEIKDVLVPNIYLVRVEEKINKNCHWR